MSIKMTPTDNPVLANIAKRWSPLAFQDQPVPDTDLRSLFEAARWAASSHNEQPWRFIVATKMEPEEFNRILVCLTDKNQIWARAASVLVLGIVSLKYKHNDKINRSAVHDLGLAQRSDEPTSVAACELVLEGLAAQKRISRSEELGYARLRPERPNPPFSQGLDFA